MKEIIKEEEITKVTTTYVCEGCNHHAAYKCIIEECERKHACNHENIEYKLDIFYEGIEVFIMKECKECHTMLGSHDIRDYDDNQNILKQMYELFNNK